MPAGAKQIMYYKCAVAKQMAMNTINAQQSSLYRSTRLYFCVSLITVVLAPCIPHRPLLWLFGSGKNVWVAQTSGRLGSPILWFPLYVVCWCLIYGIALVVCRITSPFLRLCMVSFLPLFLLLFYDNWRAKSTAIM